MTGERCFHIVIPLFIGIIGFIIAISTMRLAARYVALYVSCPKISLVGDLTVVSFLMAQSYSGFICFLTWTSNTFARPPSKRAVALAFINAFSQLGNIAGSWVPRSVVRGRSRLLTVIPSSYVWQKSWGPTYAHSYVICVSTSALCIVMCFILRQALSEENKRLDENESSAGSLRGRGYRYML